MEKAPRHVMAFLAAFVVQVIQPLPSMAYDIRPSCLGARPPQRNPADYPSINPSQFFKPPTRAQISMAQHKCERHARSAEFHAKMQAKKDARAQQTAQRRYAAEVAPQKRVQEKQQAELREKQRWASLTPAQQQAELKQRQQQQEAFWRIVIPAIAGSSSNNGGGQSAGDSDNIPSRQPTQEEPRQAPTPYANEGFARAYSSDGIH